MCEKEASDDDSFESVFPILGTGTGMLYKTDTARYVMSLIRGLLMILF